MNKITITIETKGEPDAELIGTHATHLRNILLRWDKQGWNKPEDSRLIDYNNARIGYKVERGIKDTF